MPDGKYCVLALLPEAGDFTLERAVAHFAGLTFSKFRSGKFVVENVHLRAELTEPTRARKVSGFRVFYGDWSVVAWLDTGKGVLCDSQNLAEDDDLPGPAEVIAGCSRRLSVWSDEDLEFDWTDEFNDYTDELRERFGVFIYDDVNGCWWA